MGFSINRLLPSLLFICLFSAGCWPTAVGSSSHPPLRGLLQERQLRSTPMASLFTMMNTLSIIAEQDLEPQQRQGYWHNIMGHIGTVPGEVEDFSRLAVGAGTICEIGFNAGHSAAVFLSSNPTAQYYVVDLLELAYSARSQAAIQRLYPGRTTFIRGNSQQLVPGWFTSHNITCDVFSVDGDHSYEGSKADLLHAIAVLRPGGVLLADDVSQQHSPGVAQAWQELLEARLITDPHCNSAGADQPNKRWCWAVTASPAGAPQPPAPLPTNLQQQQQQQQQDNQKQQQQQQQVPGSSSAQPRRWFLTFQDTERPQYVGRARALVQQARSIGGFDEAHAYPRTDIPPWFWQRAAPLADGRGLYWWVWKPFIIWDTLQRMPEGDVLLYMDSMYDILAPLTELTALEGMEHGDARFWCNKPNERNFTVEFEIKRDVLRFFRRDNPSTRAALAFWAGSMALRKTQRVMLMVSQWLHFSLRPALVDASPSRLPEHPGYGGIHQADQAVLTLVAMGWNHTCGWFPTGPVQNLRVPFQVPPS